MRLLEYESKTLLEEAGVGIPCGQLVQSAANAAGAARQLGCPVVLKPQIPAGGRGKAGGLAFISTPEEALPAAERLLSQPLRCYEVKSLLVEEQVEIAQEFFLSVTYDNGCNRIGKGAEMIVFEF